MDASDKVSDEAQYPDLYKRWTAELDAAKKPEEKFRTRARAIERRYLDEQNDDLREYRARRFNILWSNTQILNAALFSQDPTPIIERRYHDPDPVSRQAAEVLSRAVEYHLDQTPFHETLKSAVFDAVLIGRGVARIRYVPQIQAQQVTFEEVIPEYIHWEDFSTSPCRRWDQVRWLAYRSRMTKRQVVERFGPQYADVPLTATGSPETDTTKSEENQLFKRADIYEIWDKADQQVIWLAKGYDKGVLQTMPDPLGLPNFWPQPEPLTFCGTNSDIIPKAEYDLYRDQAEEIDELTRRINLIIKSIRVAGVYDQTNSELQNFLSQVENTMTPIKNWQVFAEKAGMKGAIDWLPIQPFVETLVQLAESRERIKQELYEITGISDIVRGASQPNETATAQRIKGQYASIRLKDKQDRVATFARDLIELIANTIAQHFSTDTLKQMTGVQLPDAPVMPGLPMPMAAE